MTLGRSGARQSCAWVAPWPARRWGPCPTRSCWAPLRLGSGRTGSGAPPFGPAQGTPESAGSISPVSLPFPTRNSDAHSGRSAPSESRGGKLARCTHPGPEGCPDRSARARRRAGAPRYARPRGSSAPPLVLAHDEHRAVFIDEMQGKGQVTRGPEHPSSSTARRCI